MHFIPDYLINFLTFYDRLQLKTKKQANEFLFLKIVVIRFQKQISKFKKDIKDIFVESRIRIAIRLIFLMDITYLFEVVNKSIQWKKQ